jgi:hypothetical protein
LLHTVLLRLFFYPLLPLPGTKSTQVVSLATSVPPELLPNLVLLLALPACLVRITTSQLNRHALSAPLDTSRYVYKSSQFLFLFSSFHLIFLLS